jgi:hypothetical protein
MGEIVNLRRARKAQGRRKEEQRAEENRLRFGLSKAEKQLAEKTNELAERRIEGHRLDSPGRPESDYPQ